MASAPNIAKAKAILVKAFPGIRFTSEGRTRAEQDDLIRRGKTRARNSQHLMSDKAPNGTALDIVLPKGTTPSAVRAVLAQNDIEPGEFINETGKGSNQGTAAHLHVGLAPKGGDPASGGSTYDQIVASRQDSGPSIAKVYEAYKSGKMDPTDAAQFEHDVLNGAVMLPRGGVLRKEPAVFQLPANVVQAYNSRRMSDEDRAQIDEDLKNGIVALPRGAKLQAPPPRTFIERTGLGARNVLTALPGLVDIPAAGVNAVINAATGSQLSATPFRDLANAGLDKIGLPTPESDDERLSQAITEGGVQGLATYGLGTALAPAKGIAGAVGSALAASPAIDTVSGAMSGASSEVARQAGAGPVGQLLAGVAGGGVPALAHPLVKARLGRNAGKDITEITTAPKEAMIEPNGDLTPDGREFAAQNGIEPSELKQAYGEAPPDVKRSVANDGAESVPAARVAGEEVVPAEVAPEAPQARPVAPEEAVAAPVAPEAAPVEPALPATAKARVEEAATEQVPLTRGQATQEFPVQDAEQTLLAGTGKESEAARTFRVQQADAIKEAVTRFQEGIGDTSLNATSRGELVQQAIRDLRDAGAAGVSAFYKQAEAISGQEIGLVTNDIRHVAQDILIDEAIPEGVRRSVAQELAKYGLVGKAEPINEVGITKVKLDRGAPIEFRGEARPLTVANAETLRKRINELYTADPTHRSQALKPAIDDAVTEAIEAAVNNPELAKVSSLLQQGRKASQEQRATFKAKDVVQQIVDFKKGTGTDVLKAENVIKTIMGTGPEALTNLRKIKAILLSKPTEQSKAAWQAIKAHGIADIFGKSVVENANLGNGSIGAISGAKLSTAIEKFGIDKLKVLLDPSEFNQLMKLRRIIRNATVPITGTTNPSGSAYKIMKFMTPLAGKLSGVPGLGKGIEVVSHLASKAKEISEAKATLKGITEYTAEQAADETAKSPDIAGGILSEADQKAREFIKSFIDIAGSERLIAPIIAAGSQRGADE